MKTAHTPTPYRYEAMDNQYGYRIYAGEKQKLRIVATCTAPHGGAGIETMTPKAKANAAFIVRAVNSHTELVMRLEDVERMIENAWLVMNIRPMHDADEVEVRNDMMRCLREDIQKALAKAKGDA